ncbi:hypothetical protein KUV89_15610, partial [Marinobacter hydrocarbonoclasticus]|nr:hypothetical protein [Marinobacter nauticus]
SVIVKGVFQLSFPTVEFLTRSPSGPWWLSVLFSAVPRRQEAHYRAAIRTRNPFFHPHAPSAQITSKTLLKPSLSGTDC